MPDNKPYYPHKKITFGNCFFYIKTKVHSLNAFDKESIAEAKQEILKEARKVSPSYKDFIKAATMATKLSETSIVNILKGKK